MSLSFKPLVPLALALTLGLSLLACNEQSTNVANANPKDTVVDTTFGLSPDTNYYLKLPAPGTQALSANERAIMRFLFTPDSQNLEIAAMYPEHLIDAKAWGPTFDTTTMHPACQAPELDSLRCMELVKALVRIGSLGLDWSPYDLDLGFTYRYVPEHAMDTVFGANLPNGYGWKKFRKMYPRTAGIMGISRIVFSADSMDAVIGTSDQCGSLCGSRSVTYLRKVDGAWTRLAVLMHTVS